MRAHVGKRISALLLAALLLLAAAPLPVRAAEPSPATLAGLVEELRASGEEGEPLSVGALRRTLDRAEALLTGQETAGGEAEDDTALDCAALCALLAEFPERCGFTLPCYDKATELAWEDGPEDPAAAQLLVDGKVMDPKRLTDPKAPRTLTAAETAEILERLFLYMTAEEDLDTPFGMPLSTRPEGPARDAALFDSACFIGHSLVYNMRHFELCGADLYGLNGASALRGMRYGDYPVPGSQVRSTISYALHHREYETVYVMYGINDLTSAADSAAPFISGMKQLAELLRETQPEADVCLISIAPISLSQSHHVGFTEHNICNINRVMKGLARYYGFTYLNVFDLLADEDGLLSAEAGSYDGLHWGRRGYELLLDFLLRHASPD